MTSQYDFIWRALRRLGLPAQAADDAAQQVFLVFSRRIEDVAEGAERTFLYRTAVRVACDARRTHARHAARSSGDEVATLADPSPNPEELTDRKQARALLDALLDTLDDDLREIFVLFELDRLPMPEISELLALPEGTCRSRLRRAREAFKDALERMRSKHAHNQARSR
jgi:RNA polymerase sigma-70 factor (ECF subfamily)